MAKKKGKKRILVRNVLVKSSKKLKKNLRKKSGTKLSLRTIKNLGHKKMIRISTGIKNLDKMVGGGVEKGSINLLIGGSGSGKSIFATQFLIDGLKKGEKCLHVSFEEKKESFYTNMYGLGWDLEKYEKQGKFFFLEYTPEKIRSLLDEGGGEIESVVLNEGINRLSIDSITPFTLLFGKEYEKRNSILALFTLLKKWNATVVITYERDPLVDEKNYSRIVEVESDSIIMLYLIRGRTSRDKYIEVLKMKGTDHSNKIFPYDIVKGGVKIGTKPYAGEVKFV